MHKRQQQQQQQQQIHEEDEDEREELMAGFIDEEAERGQARGGGDGWGRSGGQGGRWQGGQRGGRGRSVDVSGGIAALGLMDSGLALTGASLSVVR